MSLIPILKRPPVSRKPIEYTISYPGSRLTVVDHGDIFLFGGTYQRISPVELEALTTMQIQKFIYSIIESELIDGTEIRERMPVTSCCRD